MQTIFQYPIDSPQLGTLLFSAVAAFIYLFLVAGTPSARRTGVKTLAIALLAVLSVLFDGPILLTIALLACAAGDALLAQDDERAFLLGLIAFLIGHIGYAALFASHGDVTLVAAQPWRVVVGIVMVLVAAVAARRLLPGVATMRLPVSLYMIVIVVMGLSSLLMDGWGVAIGAVLFMASDLVLAAQKFLLPSESKPYPRALFVWISYYLAQVVITLSVLELA